MHPIGGSKNLYSILFAVVDSNAELELKVRYVVDVMEACLVDSLSLISVCENVCFLFTHRRNCFCIQLVIYGVVKCSAVIYAVRQLQDCLLRFREVLL